MEEKKNSKWWVGGGVEQPKLERMKNMYKVTAVDSSRLNFELCCCCCCCGCCRPGSDTKKKMNANKPHK